MSLGRRRIICLTETLYLLGEEDRIVGISRMVGAEVRAETLISRLRAGLEAARRAALALLCRPRIYFEELDDPLISGTWWISELVGISGGEGCFPELSVRPGAGDRVIKKSDSRRVLERHGWQGVSGIRHGRLLEIKSCAIPQPGPAALTDRLRQLREIITQCAQEMPHPGTAAMQVEAAGSADFSGRGEPP